MSEVVVRRESAVEFFREQVERALARQGLAARELTSFYVVHLLAGFVRRRSGDDNDTALGVRLLKALESQGAEQRASLREIGDISLFISGFFADSLHRRLVDVDYYVQIGGCAYSTLGRNDADTLAPVFAELGDNFVSFVDILSEVSERTACTTNTDLLRLYERWLRTGSSRSGQLLVERGVVPNESLKNTRIQ